MKHNFEINTIVRILLQNKNKEQNLPTPRGEVR